MYFYKKCYTDKQILKQGLKYVVSNNMLYVCLLNVNVFYLCLMERCITEIKKVYLDKPSKIHGISFSCDYNKCREAVHLKMIMFIRQQEVKSIGQF